jgi:hypothetical protein
MAGAPHLPKFCWGLSDLQAAYVHKVLPQKANNMKSAWEMSTGRPPNLEAMFIKVFGCACQYAPMEGAEHKRANKTKWGWFVGIQWPMALVLRPEDMKVISVSRKKVHCHELCYAKFDPTTQPRPVIHFTDFTMNEEEVDAAILQATLQNQKDMDEATTTADRPKHVKSIKSLSDFRRNQEMNMAQPTPRPHPSMLLDLPHLDHQGEQSIGEEQLQRDDLMESIGGLGQHDNLMEEVRKWKACVENGADGSTRTDSIVKALRKVEEVIGNQAPKRGELKKKGKTAHTRSGIDQKNITAAGKKRRVLEKETKDVWDLKTKTTNVIKLQKGVLNIGDSVKTLTKRFGKDYALGKPKFTFGIVKKMKGKLVSILWEGERRSMNSKATHLIKVDGASIMLMSDDGEQMALPMYRCAETPEEEDWSIDDLIEGDKEMFDQLEESMDLQTWQNFKKEHNYAAEKWNSLTILPIMEVGASLSANHMGGTWPRDFYEALVRPDWRRWVEAVKDEIESWNVFEACEEVSYLAVQQGASVIPLGELFTIKRNGKYKFRQIALGNLLKEGKDYAETFASTISGDGIRWFCALAASCGRSIFGWDAKTGYLQTTQRIPIYAYLPSHHGYSNLTYEELAELRNQMILLLKQEGMEGIKRFSRDMRKERRIRPKTVLKLNRSIYGVPDAGQSFAMFMQSLHLKKCGMVQSEMDPCIYYKILQRDGGNEPDDDPILEEYLLAITWVDDVRYFGTKRLVKEYESTIAQHCKCTFEGESKEFVSIEIYHKAEERILELKQADYWVKAR